MARQNIKQRNDLYQQRCKQRKTEQQKQPAANQAKPIQPEVQMVQTSEQFTIDPLSLFLLTTLLLIMIAIPSFEQHRRTEIHSLFIKIVDWMQPATDLGLYSIFLYAGIVAVWDGLGLLPVRYIELFVAMSFTSVQQFILIMILGKTLGGQITHKIANSLLQKDKLLVIMFTNSSSFVFESIQQLICKHPFLYGLLIRMFFPSVLINFYLALTPISKTQFIFIQFLYASIVSYPQALFDYYGFLDKKFKLIDGQVRIIYTQHSDLVMKALENRMDLFKLTFVICQLVSLIFVSLRILFYNNALHATFVKGIKERLIEINQAQGIQLIETKAGKPELVNPLAEPEEAEDEGSSMTREQIKICIKKLNRIAKEKGQSFEKTIDQIFNVKLEDSIPKMPSDITPESIFKQMLKQINDKYGDHIKGVNEAVSRTEVNAFIDKLANETQLDVLEETGPNPQGSDGF